MNLYLTLADQDALNLAVFCTNPCSLLYDLIKIFSNAESAGTQRHSYL